MSDRDRSGIEPVDPDDAAFDALLRRLPRRRAARVGRRRARRGCARRCGRSLQDARHPALDRRLRGLASTAGWSRSGWLATPLLDNLDSADLSPCTSTRRAPPRATAPRCSRRLEQEAARSGAGRC